MAILKTKRNMIAAYEPLPEDVFVLTYVGGSKHTFLQSVTTIAQYSAAVNWAFMMADKLVHMVAVVPVTQSEYLQMVVGEAHGASALNSLGRHFELLQDWVVVMLAILHESHDVAEIAMARKTLVNLGVAT